MFGPLDSLTLPHPDLRLKHCRHGVMLYNRRDNYVGASLDLYGEFAELEAQLFAGLIKPGMLVIEVGANIGMHTVHLGRLVGPNGGVVAFEPQRHIFQMLCANLALNGIVNADPQRLAIGVAPGEAMVARPDYLEGGDPEEAVDMIALDNLSLPACHLLKIGTAGMTKTILDGARNTIARHRPFIYLRNEKPDDHAMVIATMLDLEYRMWWHLPPLFNPGNLAGQSENMFPDSISFNLICLPQEGAPEEIEGGIEVKTAADPHPLMA